jgi:hypothetical protein
MQLIILAAASSRRNERVSLRRCAVTISFADDARAPFEYCLCGRVGCRGGGLALVPVRLCRSNFQALTTEALVLPAWSFEAKGK